MYNEFQSQSTKNEMNECLSKGICSVSPALSSLQEVVLLHLKALSFYLLKLRQFGITNAEMKENVIEALIGLVIDVEYNQEQFHKIISKLSKGIKESKILYQNFCQKNNVDAESTKLYFKHSKTFSLNEAIKRGEKYYLKKSNILTEKQKELYDIMLFLIKSISIKIFEYKKLGKEKEDFYYAILSMLNSMILSEFSKERVTNEIRNFINLYCEVSSCIFKTQLELYGPISKVSVSFSTVPGKAILVSGADFNKLEQVLKATKNTEINVYTHGPEMIMAHSFQKIRSYPNLKGHFGQGVDSSLIAFAEFPGAILMTKASLQRAEYLYRGRLFTLDPIAPQGIVKIREDNYEPLIKAALDSTGFIHGRQKPSMFVGFLEEEVNSKIDQIIEKIKTKEIRHLYIIGMFNYLNSCSDYFESFFDLLPDDCFAISLACKRHGENIFHLESFNDCSLIYRILYRLNLGLSFNEINTSIFVTKCDKNTILGLLYFRDLGIKNLYMSKCSPSLINPALVKTLRETFDIKEFSNPKQDITDTLTLA